MVSDAAPLGGRNFRGADVEVPVDLSRVANENFAAQLLGKMDSKLGFAGGSRPENHQEPRKFAHPENFQIAKKQDQQRKGCEQTGPRRLGCGSTSPGIRPLIPGNIVEEPDAKLEIWAVELWGQGLEGVRRVNRGHCGIVERFLAGRPFEGGIGWDDASIRQRS